MQKLCQYPPIVHFSSLHMLFLAKNKEIKVVKRGRGVLMTPLLRLAKANLPAKENEMSNVRAFLANLGFKTSNEWGQGGFLRSFFVSAFSG